MKPLVALAAAALGLLVVELGHRGWSAATGAPYSAVAARAELLRLADPTREFVPEAGEAEAAAPGPRRPLLHPYAGSESEHDTGGVLRSFRKGFAPEDYTVLVVGGSVAAGWAVQDRARFEARLAADPRLVGRRPRLLNYAHAAYKQPQPLTRVAYLLALGARPDAVLALDGFNEVALGYANALSGIHPVYPSPPVWAALVRGLDALDADARARAARQWLLAEELRGTADRTIGLGLHRSSVLGTLALRRMGRLGRERAALYAEAERAAEGRAAAPGGDPLARQADGPEFAPGPRAVLEACARNWFESSLSLSALCAARGIHYVHVLQPALHDAGSKPLSEAERALPPPARGWAEGAEHGYPLLRARGAELAALGVRFRDASRVFAEHGETLYLDACHVDARGNALLGDALAELFLASLPER